MPESIKINPIDLKLQSRLELLGGHPIRKEDGAFAVCFERESDPERDFCFDERAEGAEGSGDEVHLGHLGGGNYVHELVLGQELCSFCCCHLRFGLNLFGHFFMPIVPLFMSSEYHANSLHLSLQVGAHGSRDLFLFDLIH